MGNIRTRKLFPSVQYWNRNGIRFTNEASRVIKSITGPLGKVVAVNRWIEGWISPLSCVLHSHHMCTYNTCYTPELVSHRAGRFRIRSWKRGFETLSKLLKFPHPRFASPYIDYLIGFLGGLEATKLVKCASCAWHIISSH